MNFLGEFRKSACGPSAVNIAYGEIASNLPMCLKPYEKPMDFACFGCARHLLCSQGLHCVADRALLFCVIANASGCRSANASRDMTLVIDLAPGRDRKKHGW